MPDLKSRNPADLVKYYVEAIMAEHAKLIECYANIAEYGEQLRRVSAESERKLIGRS